MVRGQIKQLLSLFLTAIESFACEHLASNLKLCVVLMLRSLYRNMMRKDFVHSLLIIQL